MEHSYLYDIRTSANALCTLVNFTGVVPPIWEKYISRQHEFQNDEDLIEYVVNRYGQFPDEYENWMFIYFHITTSANNCASFNRHGILDLRESYECPDSELRQFLDNKGISINIQEHILRYKGKSYNISYDIPMPPMGTKAYACWSIGRKFYYDFTTCGFLSIWERSEYGGYVHQRPEILYNIDELLGLDLSHEWYATHDPYEIVAAIKGSDILYDGFDNSSSKMKILYYLTKAYNTAFGEPFEEIILMKNHVQVPPNHILEINPVTYW